MLTTLLTTIAGAGSVAIIIIVAFKVFGTEKVLPIVAGACVGFGAASYIFNQINKTALMEMLRGAQAVQTQLQKTADEARDEASRLSLQLQEKTDEVIALRVDVALGAGKLRNSEKLFADRLGAVKSSCLSRESAAAFARALNQCGQLLQEGNTSLGKCAADAGQCGIDRAALLRGWPRLTTESKSQPSSSP